MGMMIRANEDANATQFLIGFMFAFKFDNWFIGGCSVAKTVIPITYMLLTLVYKFTLIMTLSVSILFGLKIDLTLRYPEYALSAKLNWFHVLTFLLWMFDYLNLMKTLWKKIIKPCRRKIIKPCMRKAQETFKKEPDPERVGKDTG